MGYSFAPMPVGGGYGGATAYASRSVPMMPMPMAPLIGGTGSNYGVGMGGTGQSWSPMPGKGVPGSSGGGYTTTTTTSFPLYPPEYKLHFDGSCVDPSILKKLD